MLRLYYILGSAVVVAALAFAGVYTWRQSEANPDRPELSVAASQAADGSVPAPAAPAPAAAPAAVPAAVPDAAVAATPIPEAARQARGKALAKLTFSEPREVSALSFTDPSGGTHALADYRGKWLLVNFWAVWCVPCRAEMPALDALQAELGGEKFEVLTIAAGRNEPAAIDRFFAETGLKTLPKLLDPKMALAGEMGVPGLPVSVVISPSGQEVARLIGEADWASPEAQAVFRALING